MTPIPFLLVALLSSASIPGCAAWQCEVSCGGIPLTYPFGSGINCGSPSFQPFINCTHNKLYFHTPTGRYPIQTIDYINNAMIVTDPKMSTCDSAGSCSSFGLPIGAPFSFAPYNTIALLGCTSVSSLYAKQSCDPSSSQEICRSLYNTCPSIGYLQGTTTALNPSTSCCVYSQSLLNSAPYEVDLTLLQCSGYTSAYRIGNVHDPQNSWLYGIALQFNPGSSQTGGSTGGDHPTCYVCQEALDSSANIIRVTQIWILSSAGLMALVMGAYLIMVSA